MKREVILLDGSGDMPAPAERNAEIVESAEKVRIDVERHLVHFELGGLRVEVVAKVASGLSEVAVEKPLIVVVVRDRLEVVDDFRAHIFPFGCAGEIDHPQLRPVSHARGDVAVIDDDFRFFRYRLDGGDIHVDGVDTHFPSHAYEEVGVGEAVALAFVENLLRRLFDSQS